MPPAQFYRTASGMHGVKAAGVRSSVTGITSAPETVVHGTEIPLTDISAALILRAWDA